MCLNLIIWYLVCHHHGRNVIKCLGQPHQAACSVREIQARKRRFCSSCESHFKPYDVNDRQCYENYNRYLLLNGLSKPADPWTIPHDALFDYTLYIVPFKSPDRDERSQYPQYFRQPESLSGYPLGTTRTNNLGHYLQGMRTASQEEWTYDTEKPLPSPPVSSTLSITEAYIQALRGDKSPAMGLNFEDFTRS